MTKTVYRNVGSKRFSPRPKLSTKRSLGSFDMLMARIDNASARLKATRRKGR